ncbi:glycerol-3-phosphate 1-O-acyltransferase PlsY [Sporolactobacillus terrae]|uniref:Glycerol-3-phosphate acyltransferase n=1 Tax=Sporolactobacillus terrae TaxID=269673 RepID=A0ABX5Q7I6_9BACL|nr:glycerol-3-phosphate 1-O-acyltransferase PlsY [Sporolactobacillus terrae]QAA22624.1 acyl-phosphate glycerol 3-phosphate acyltransferase [Sporolactobacillus terrae]QAA25598.1 acyl-phosphate glycerol 3-phosphate acyltransferase [Sporolactobacillus terrae]UAK17406.1 glycerol-3-phosphate 1-O-acyltransferase PlsY [Sporolactobacillus terrae]
MWIALSTIISYLIGSISFSYLITKKIKKIDIRKTGSGNAGATNTLRVLGTGPAVGVLLLDVLKGVISILIAQAFGLPEWAVALSGLASIIGHDFPIYYGFKGGKGVATTIGVFFMIMPLYALIAGVITLLIIFATRFVSLGSLFFLLAVPVLGWIFHNYSAGVLVVAFLITILAFYQHRANINRLIHGKENKLGHKKVQA